MTKARNLANLVDETGNVVATTAGGDASNLGMYDTAGTSLSVKKRKVLSINITGNNCTGFLPSGNCSAAVSNGYIDPNLNTTKTYTNSSGNQVPQPVNVAVPPDGQWWLWTNYGFSGIPTGNCGNPSGYDFGGGSSNSLIPLTTFNSNISGAVSTTDEVFGTYQVTTVNNCNCNSGLNSVGNCYTNCNCNCNCGKIICTKLHELGLMNEDVFLADQEYGELLKKTNPNVYEGYIRWASIVVEWMSGNTPNFMLWIKDKKKRQEKELKLILKVTYRIATPWAEHMQYIMGKTNKDNKAGKFIMKIGSFVSKIINKFPKKNLSPSYFQKISMICFFYFIYLCSKLFGNNSGFPKAI
jgi:hypothetical protein